MRNDPPAGGVRRALSKALLVLAGTGVALLVAEVALRLHPVRDMPVNDPYRFTKLVGARQFHVPFHSYREIYPLELDHDGYYRRSDGAIDYHFDDAGGRWTEPRARDREGRVGVVVGDSFTLGFGLRYEDAYIFLVEQALQQQGDRRQFVNLSEPGADARISLRNYLAVRDTLAHDLVLYGLHLNDLISFPTSYVETETAAPAPAVWRWRLGGFVARTLGKRRERAERIRYLSDPAQLHLPRFTDNMAAIETMQRESTSRGARFYVVILPILVDLRAATFDPIYTAIRRSLEQRGVSYVDLTHSLDGASDSAYWILPFDQHPNERANAAFAQPLTNALRKADGTGD